MLLVHKAVIMICSQQMNWIKLTFRSRTPIRKWVRKQQCELPALDYMYVFRTYGAPQDGCQHSSKDRTHHTDTTLLLGVCVCVWRGCGVAVVCSCGRSAWCAWSLDEGWHLWATIRTDWASTVPVSLQPIASWRWRAWPMNTSCNWVDLLQAGQFSFSSVYVLRTNLYRQFEDRWPKPVRNVTLDRTGRQSPTRTSYSRRSMNALGRRSSLP